MSSINFNVVSFREFKKEYYMHVAWHAENALVKISKANLKTPNIPKRLYWLKQNRIARNIIKICRKLEPSLYYDTGRDLFLFLMGFDKLVFDILRDSSKNKWIYLFDTWEPNWTNMEKEMKHWKNINSIYFASMQTAQYFSTRLSFPVKWVPQAADCEEFIQNENTIYKQKLPIIFNIGRVNNNLKNFFKKFSSKYNYRFLIQKLPGELVAPNRLDYIRTLLQSSIILVHPQNIDSPEVTGKVSTLTARYYEAYNTGSVVCGIKPTSGEFDKVLKDYPFIEYIDDESFEKAILESLKYPEIWNQAKQRVRKEHTWEVRLSCLIKDLPT